MKRIFKYPVRNEFTLPRGAKILHVALQNDGPKVWAEVDDDEQRTESYGVVGTGATLNPLDTHCGTWQSGPFVWHLYRMPDLDEEDAR